MEINNIDYVATAAAEAPIARTVAPMTMTAKTMSVSTATATKQLKKYTKSNALRLLNATKE